MTYRIAVSRCAACKGTGTVKEVYEVVQTLVGMPVKGWILPSP